MADTQTLADPNAVPPIIGDMITPVDKSLKSLVDKDFIHQQQVSKDALAENKSAQTRAQELYDKHVADVKSLGEVKPIDPSLMKFSPPAPENPVNNFGSFASTMAILASSMTRAPLTTALNAAAAGMNAVKQGNAEAYESAYKTWKANSDAAFKQHESEMADHNAALDTIKTNYQLGTEMMKTQAILRKDEYGLRLLENGDVPGYIEKMNSLSLIGERARKAADETATRALWQPAMINYQNSAKDYLEAVKAYKDKPTPENLTAVQNTQSTMQTAQKDAIRSRAGAEAAAQGREDPNALAAKKGWKMLQDSKTGAVYRVNPNAEGQIEMMTQNGPIPVSTLPPGLAELGKKSNLAEPSITKADALRIAHQFLKGDRSGMAGLGYGTSGVAGANRSLIQSTITEEADKLHMTGEDISAQMAAFSGLMQEQRSIGVRLGAIKVSSEEAKNVAGLVQDAYAKLPRTDFKPFNELESLYANQTNSPEQGAAYAADFSLVTAYARALNPQGVPREQDINAAEKFLNTNGDSYERHMAAVGQILKEIDSIQSAAGLTRQKVIDEMHQNGAVSGKRQHYGGEIIERGGRYFQVKDGPNMTDPDIEEIHQ